MPRVTYIVGLEATQLKMKVLISRNEDFVLDLGDWKSTEFDLSPSRHKNKFEIVNSPLSLPCFKSKSQELSILENTSFTSKKIERESSFNLSAEITKFNGIQMEDNQFLTKSLFSDKPERDLIFSKFGFLEGNHFITTVQVDLDDLYHPQKWKKTYKSSDLVLDLMSKIFQIKTNDRNLLEISRFNDEYHDQFEIGWISISKFNAIFEFDFGDSLRQLREEDIFTNILRTQYSTAKFLKMKSAVIKPKRW